ncbi:hypothetical protein FGG78_35335 [Thioclava sp. BHET1]|nr:hypothetical protein FGG78_35335 [Thioclava sp. BHET1]
MKRKIFELLQGLDAPWDGDWTALALFLSVLLCTAALACAGGLIGPAPPHVPLRPIINAAENLRRRS